MTGGDETPPRIACWNYMSGPPNKLVCYVCELLGEISMNNLVLSNVHIHVLVAWRVHTCWRNRCPSFQPPWVISIALICLLVKTADTLNDTIFLPGDVWTDSSFTNPSLLLMAWLVLPTKGGMHNRRIEKPKHEKGFEIPRLYSCFYVYTIAILKFLAFWGFKMTDI